MGLCAFGHAGEEAGKALSLVGVAVLYWGSEAGACLPWVSAYRSVEFW